MDKLYCDRQMGIGMTSIWIKDNPLNHNFQVFTLQLCIASLFSGSMKALLQPFGQSSFISQLIVGIILGPSCLGRLEFVKEQLLHPKKRYTMETLQTFSSMFFIFLIGVKTDLSIVKKSGKKAWVIGLSLYIVPLVLCLSLYYIIYAYVKDKSLASHIDSVGALMSLISFHDIGVVLDDLKLLNTEIGRLAMSTSMISGVCSMGSAFIALVVQQSKLIGEDSPINPNSNNFYIIISCFAMFLVILLLVRPLTLWMIKQTPEGENVKQEYIYIIFVLVWVSSIIGEYGGTHFLVGPMMIGLAVPVGPPLGSAIEHTLDFFVKGLLFPLMAVSYGLRLNISEISRFEQFVTVEFMILFSVIGKFVGTLLPALFCGMPFKDSLLLGLLMNVQGLLDLRIWIRATRLQLLDKVHLSEMMLSMVIITGTITPIVKALYDPSRRYVTYKRRTIQHSARTETELRILACIYHDENVPTIIDLLEASHPTRYSPISVYALHLIQLQGRASPLLIAHKGEKDRNSSHFSQSTRIINALNFYKQDYHGLVSVNSLTAISPYITMHDDICTLGLDKRITLIIIPFHHQPSVISSSHTMPGIRKVNQNVLNNAPCSVGILIDRKLNNVVNAPSTPCTLGNKISYRVAVIFLGGADDREALAYGARMGEDINLSLSVFRVINRNNERIDKSQEEQMDYDAIDEFRMNTIDNENVDYTEEEVGDAVEFISFIRSSMETPFDLLMIGRHHGEESRSLLQGIGEWSEFPELGIVGDMLISSDLKIGGSILVVQQQPRTTSRSLINVNSYTFDQLV